MADVLSALQYYALHNFSDKFRDHANWYEREVPQMLDTYPELGLKRVTGSPRHVAAEFAGAADWGRLAPADYYDALNAAEFYHDKKLFATQKNRQDNKLIDAAGLATGICNPLLSREELIPLAVRYAQQNYYGVAPQYKKGGLALMNKP